MTVAMPSAANSHVTAPQLHAPLMTGVCLGHGIATLATDGSGVASVEVTVVHLPQASADVTVGVMVGMAVFGWVSVGCRKGLEGGESSA